MYVRFLPPQDATETFTEEPSSWPYVFGPPFWVLFVLVFVIARVVSPWLGQTFFPDSHSKLGKKLSLFNSLVCSTLHAVLVSGLIFYILATDCMGGSRVFSKCYLGFLAMQCSLGYFCADLISCLTDSELRKDKSMLAHHVIGIIGLFLGLFHQGKFMFFIVYRFINESSTPFVNTFWLLKILKKQKSTIFLVNSLLMVAVFFACRICPIWWHWSIFYRTLMDPAVVLLPWYLRLWTVLTYVIFDALNLAWFWKMFRGAIRYFVKSDKTVVD